MADDWEPVQQAQQDDWEPVSAAKGQSPAVGADLPEAFVGRLKAGQALGRVLSAAGAGAVEGAGQGTPTGFEDETLNHLIDLGIFHDPAKGRPGPIQMANEAVMIPAAKVWDTITRATAGGIHGAGGAIEQIVNEFGGSQGTANRAKDEVINLGNWAMIESGMGRFTRPGVEQSGVADRQVGNLPTPQDFQAAGKVMDSPHAEANLQRMWQEDGIHPAEAVHDAQADAFLKHQITAPREEIKPDPETERVLEETGGKPGSLSAAATDPADVPLDVQPPQPAGSLIASAQKAADTLFDVGRDIQMKLTPMARGSVESMATVKDYMNAMRRNAWDSSRIDTDIVNKFSAGQRERMARAMEEESLSRRLAEPDSAREHQGLATLEPEERAAVQQLDNAQQLAWLRARDAGVVEGDGIPMHFPRMAIGAKGDSEIGKPPSLTQMYGIRKNSPYTKQRQYMEAEETEQALKAKYGDQAKIAWDIRSVNLATKMLEDSTAGRTLINNIQEIGKRTGEDTVAEGFKPGEGWFTVDHPAFQKWRPRLDENGVVKDAAGNPVFDQVPIYVRGDFEGPIRSALWGKTGVAYRGLMALKGKIMSYIMNSPLIHNAVEYGRAFAAMPLRMMTPVKGEGALFSPYRIKVYADGYRAKNDPGTMHEAIANGLVPIGKRFFNQDINAIMEAPDLTPGRSIEAKLAAFVPGLFDEAAGTAVKQAIDKAGDFWHNRMLWDRIADLQAGLYVNFRDDLLAKGHDPDVAAKIAAHYANRFAGALPKEAMSEMATKVSNFLMFSRSFTLGNLGVMKDMLTGLPKDVMAQIERDAGLKEGSIAAAQPVTPEQLRTTRAKGESAYQMSPEAVMEPEPYHSFKDMAERLPDDVNSKFQVHGLLAGDRDANLINLLENGIDPNREFHSGNPRGGTSGVDSTRTFGSPYLLISDSGKTLRTTGVKNVVASGPAEANLPALKAAYPHVNFMNVDEAERFINGTFTHQQATAPPAIASDTAALAKSLARRKAIATVAFDVALFYAGNSVLQSAINVILGGNTLDEEAHGYLRRFSDTLNEVGQHPLKALQPFDLAQRLSSTYENEPGKQDRLKIGYAKDGTGIYARSPFGKIGEEFTGWFSSPLDMMRKKEGTIMRPLSQIYSNDAGFGRKVYDPHADTIPKYAGVIKDIVTHIMAAQLPVGQGGAAADLVKGEGDSKVNALQAIGPFLGVTFSKGAPGGPAVGEMYDNKSRFEFNVAKAMPELRRQIQRGDIAGAQQTMTGLGMDPSYQRWVVKTSLDPRLRLSPRSVRDFYRTADPEQRARFQRFQQVPSQP